MCCVCQCVTCRCRCIFIWWWSLNTTSTSPDWTLCTLWLLTTSAPGCSLSHTTSLLSRSVIYTHPFNGPFSGTTQVSWYQKGRTNLDFTWARDSEWQWHQLGHMQVCTLLQADNHASTPPLSFFTGRMPFLPPNQQRQSTEGQYNCHSAGSLGWPFSVLN